MSLRTSSLILPVVLAACGRGPTGEPPPGDRIACALDGATEFAASCTLERSPAGATLHRPDGGFRRLDTGWRALDGADEAKAVTQPDGGIEIAIGGDRYRIPADALRR